MGTNDPQAPVRSSARKAPASRAVRVIKPGAGGPQQVGQANVASNLINQMGGVMPRVASRPSRKSKRS